MSSLTIFHISLDFFSQVSWHSFCLLVVHSFKFFAHSILVLPSTICLHHKVLLKITCTSNCYGKLQRTPVLHHNYCSSSPYASATKPYETTSQFKIEYYINSCLHCKVLLHLLNMTPVLLCVLLWATKYYSPTTKYYNSTTLYYNELHQYNSVLQSTTPYFFNYKALLQYCCVCNTKCYCRPVLQRIIPELLQSKKYCSSTSLYIKITLQHSTLFICIAKNHATTPI